MTGDPLTVMHRCREAALEIPGIRLVDDRNDYLRFEAVTRLCRFVDDLECLADPTNKVIHVRSASRIGHSDLGANRRRIEQIRAHLLRK